MRSRATCLPAGVAGPRMTRAEFLRALGIGTAGVAGLLSGVGGAALAARPQAPTEVDVYPTGVYPDDVREVTAAVNGGIGPSGRTYAGGGIVRLKATSAAGTPQYFNFGGATPPSADRGSVNAEKDVTIIGERLPTNAPPFPPFPHNAAPDPTYPLDRTVVYGGKRAFACRAENAVATTLTIRNIYFAYPSLAAVQVRKTAGLEVSDCVIYDVRLDDTGQGFSVAMGIEATGLRADTTALFGVFRVTNNRIRRASPATNTPIAPFADTGVVINLSSMEGQIVGNEIDWFPNFGCGVDRNDGTAVIAGNTITRCGYGNSPLSVSGGIGARGTSKPVLIERNHVTGGFAGPSSMRLSKCGLNLASSNVVVRANVVDGLVDFDGILLSTFKPTNPPASYSATDNRIERNRLTELVAKRSQAYVVATCDGNRFANNDYGTVAPATGTNAGLMVFANDGQFVNEQFWGEYGGVGATPMQPCVWFMPGTSGNALSAFKYQGAPQGKDVCDQVLDQGANEVKGVERCA